MNDHKYTYKLEDYGGGKISYVIYRDSKAIFHSNGFTSKSEAIINAKGHMMDFMYD